jgi:hypothetical protein
VGTAVWQAGYTGRVCRCVSLCIAYVAQGPQGAGLAQALQTGEMGLLDRKKNEQKNTHH